MILSALQDEISTLIHKQMKMLAELKDQKAIWTEDRNGLALNPSLIDQQLEALVSDGVKVKSLESTIAVIGTMKAGKSTTINALIGEEVLPNRVTAMTTLPTLIRHKPGQKEPELTLHNESVFQDLVNEVNSVIKSSNEKGVDLTKVQEAVNTISDSGSKIKKSYVGKDEIHKALFLINDTFRLAGHEKNGIDLSDYLKHFTDIGSLPTVEIEFKCLANKPEGRHRGSLALLDTPGPNEAGQSAVLKQILSEQIAKNASMVLLVMNYTQLNTEQDSDIRSQVKGIKEVIKDRSFVVVNRFDEKKYGDLDEGQTKKIACELLNDSIDEENFITESEVFPVSSHYAFMVDKVKQQIAGGVDVRGFLGEASNRDFLQAAFGMIDEEEIDELNLDRIEKRADKLFKKSRYDGFVGDMLEKAYIKAGENSLQVSLARLSDNARKLDHFSTVVRGGLSQELEELKSSIERTKKLSEDVEVVYNKVATVKDKGVKEYRKKADFLLNENVDNIKKAIKEEFTNKERDLKSDLEGELNVKLDSKKSLSREKYAHKRAGRREAMVLESDINILHNMIDKHTNNDGKELDFGKDKGKAVEFDKKAQEIMSSMFSTMVSKLQVELNTLEEKTKAQIQGELFGRVESLFKAYEEEMQEKGFDFDVSFLENFSLDILNQSKIEPGSHQAIQQYDEMVTRIIKKNVRREGWVHGVLKVLSFGLRDDFEETIVDIQEGEKRYKIALSGYISQAEKMADQFYKNIDQNLNEQFEAKLIPAVDEIFGEIIVSIKSIEGALDRSKKLQSNDVAVVSDIKSFMDDAKKLNYSLLQRIKTARNGLDSLVSVD
ncbi:dynamin family protein [Halomonas chromatireducens]|uniref:Clamp-binding protein CrfC n=1 Tax=Halomonas chromatireducens TaxID=507626 RepID=A0A0X8HD20_9GAMM|nr:dynamin family protein [Halomonas chromatireducens]AMD00392.1 Clamp-binding protein CrfC [Halomonas chromatireducens]